MRKLLAPPPKLTVSSWADRYRMLSRESSAEPGQWRTDRVPYAREIMDAFSDPLIERVVMMSASQVAKTEIILNVAGFYADQDPCPILIVQPNVKPMAEAFSKDRLAPMIRDCARLRGKVRDPRSRDSGNTILHKTFPGGGLTVIGANSPAGLASRPIRVVLFDEADRFPPSAGSEGDPIALGIQRTATFWNRKVGEFSTPTIKGLSRIEKDFELSDQRRYQVPCPRCGLYQVLVWSGLKYEADSRGEVVPASVHYECGACHEAIEEGEKLAMLRAGRWMADRPGRRMAGFHVNALYSPWALWGDLAQQWILAQHDPEQLKAFINLKLGEPWEDRSQEVDLASLQGRGESYEAEVPDGVGILTGGVDIQADRLELEVVGWGDQEESWRVAHHRIEGDTERQETWERLEPLLTRPYLTARGVALRIQCCMIDSGFRTRTVYGFVRPRQVRNVFASKGVEERGRAPLTHAKKANRDGVKLWTIGTMGMKDTLFGRLRIQRPGPRFMHFRAMTGDGGFDGEFFAQLGAEKPVIERRRGRRVRRYVQIRDRNEAIDLEVLNLAALHALGAGAREQLGELARRVQTAAPRPGVTASAPTPAPASRPARRVRSRGLL